MIFALGLLVIASMQTQVASAREVPSLGLELFHLRMPSLTPASNCHENIPYSGKAFSAKVITMTPAMTALNITISGFNSPAYAGIAAILIDDDAPTLAAFDRPGTKTIILQGHHPGRHTLKISTLDVFAGGDVVESSSTTTCVEIPAASQ